MGRAIVFFCGGGVGQSQKTGGNVFLGTAGWSRGPMHGDNGNVVAGGQQGNCRSTGVEGHGNRIADTKAHIFASILCKSVNTVLVESNPLGHEILYSWASV